MNRRYMLDTDIASYVIRGTDADLNGKAVAHDGRLCMSSITYHELLYGARTKDSRRQESIIAAFEEMVPVVEFSPQAADKAAEIRAALDNQGGTIGVMDALIAANAIVEGCVLVTNKTAHFSRIAGLEFENWTSQSE